MKPDSGFKFTDKYLIAEEMGTGEGDDEDGEESKVKLVDKKEDTEEMYDGSDARDANDESQD